MEQSTENMLIKFRGIIRSISKEVCTDGKTFFSVDTPLKNAKRQPDNMVRCRSFRTGLMEYMPVELEGIWDEYGFNCKKCSFIWINMETTIDYYVTLSKQKKTGIGIKKIRQMVDRYGKDIVCMDKYKMRQALLQDFPNWCITSVDGFVEAVFDTSTVLIELEQFLSAFDIDYKVILGIYEVYGQDAVKLVKKNPYQICLQFGIRMRKADAIAYAAGITALSQCRINGLIEYYLEQRANDGHTYAWAYELAEYLNRFSKTSIYATYLPAICISDAVLSNQRLHLDVKAAKIATKRLYNAEINIANRINVLIRTPSGIDIAEHDISETEQKFHIKYGKDQRASFYLLSDRGISILTGGPGTGKTSVIKGIVEVYKKYHPHAKIHFAAPTGRAAKRLTESSGYKAKTIHKLVGYKPFEKGNDVQHNAVNPLDADFVIIDETSMVDALMMEMLLLALKDTTKILFVGDENQLPSVGAGNCLHDMIASGKIPVYRLTENFRQKGNETIIDNAGRILKGKMPIANDMDFCIVKCENDTDGFETLRKLIDENYDVNDPFKVQILEPSRKGEAGIFKVNDYVHKMVHKDESTAPDIQPGDKVMFLRNQYVASGYGDAEPLYVNGEIGIIDYMDEHEIVVSDGCGDEVKVIPHSAVSDMILAYSHTIHKSQGSEYPIVIIYLPESARNMMYRSLLYTAVTRAQERVKILYTGNALELCINNVEDTKRDTRLMERLMS